MGQKFRIAELELSFSEDGTQAEFEVPDGYRLVEVMSYDCRDTAPAFDGIVEVLVEVTGSRELGLAAGQDHTLARGLTGGTS